MSWPIFWNLTCSMPYALTYTFFSAPYGTFSKTDHMLSLKASLNRYRKTRITPCLLSDHHGIKLTLNSYTNYRKPANSLKLNDSQPNYHWVKEEIKRETKDFLEFNENECTTYLDFWGTLKTMLRGKFIALSAFIKNLEEFHTSDLIANLRVVEQKEANKPKRGRQASHGYQQSMVYQVAVRLSFICKCSFQWVVGLVQGLWLLVHHQHWVLTESPLRAGHRWSRY